MKYFNPPFEVENIEQQNIELRKAFEVSPNIFAPGISDVEQEYEICLRLCKIMEGKKIRKVSKNSIFHPNSIPKSRIKKPQQVIHQTKIIIDPDKIINLVEFIAGLTKKK